MTIQKTHAPEPFVRGATGSFQLTARNSGTASTSGAVTVTDAMPAGLSATSASGSGWDCNASTAANISCTRSDALGTAGNYPPITVNVNIAFNAATQLTNTGVVAGGGEVNNTNNTDDDVVNLVDQFDVAVFKSVPLPGRPGAAAGRAGDVPDHRVQNNGPSGTAAFAARRAAAGGADPRVGGQPGWRRVLQRQRRLHDRADGARRAGPDRHRRPGADDRARLDRDQRGHDRPGSRTTPTRTTTPLRRRSGSCRCRG